MESAMHRGTEQLEEAQELIQGHGAMGSIYPDYKYGVEGDTVTLDSSKSTDAEGDNLTFAWWQQPEAGNYKAKVQIDGTSSSIAKITIPSENAGTTVHIICEVHDSGKFNLVSYARVILEME